jgi:hypothetical protein
MLQGLTRTARRSLPIGALALLAVAGVSYAAPRGGEVAACVHKQGGGLYLGRCAKHDKKLSWAKQGAAGPRGPQGSQGVAGPTGPLTTTVPSGQTVRGVFNLDNVAATGNQFNGSAISFGLSLANAPAVQIIPAGGPTTTSCADDRPSAPLPKRTRTGRRGRRPKNKALR